MSTKVISPRYHLPEIEGGRDKSCKLSTGSTIAGAPSVIESEGH